MGFVYRKDEKYLNYCETHTHTGTHRYVEWVDDLNKATVFYSLPPYQLRLSALKEAERLEVIETRTVTLK